MANGEIARTAERSATNIRTLISANFMKPKSIQMSVRVHSEVRYTNSCIETMRMVLDIKREGNIGDHS